MKQIKTILRSVRKHLDRTPNLLFHSPNKALNKALAKTSRSHPNKRINRNQSVVSSIENGLIDGISLHKDLISYPLHKKRYDEGEYLGGLVNGDRHELLKEAVHSGSQLYGDEHLCQKLPHFDRQEDLGKAPEIAANVLFGGILFNHFGHFLLESLGRLWAYDYVKEIDPYILFYAPDGIPDYLRRSNFVNQVLTGFGIPHDKLIVVNSPVKLKKAIVPRQRYGWGFFQKPDSVFLNFVRNFSFRNDVPREFKEADRIYVSRTKLPFKSGMNTHGRMIAEHLFEEYLIANGYQILYPERYNLFQQLSIYNNAKKIIFSSGSALHACILLPDLQADVAIIARWQDPKDNLFHAEQFQGYGKSVLGIDVLRGQYQLGLEHWDALSDVDWYKASLLLKEQGFVDADFSSFNQLNAEHLVRAELENYIQEVLYDHRFTDFMMKLKEQKQIDRQPLHPARMS